MKVVSERLGHSSPAFTMTVYQHVLSGMQADAAAELADRLGREARDQRAIPLAVEKAHQQPVASDDVDLPARRGLGRQRAHA